jgi:hypothetical protein
MKPAPHPTADAARTLLTKCKEVACTLAKGPPPKWLVRALIDFTLLVGGRKTTSQDVAEDREVLEAARYLERWLPAYTISDDEWNLQLPDCVETVLIALPELIEFLKSQLPPPRLGGPTPDGRRLLCAGLCAEAYDLIHRGLQLHSGVLRQGCEDYWLACGNPETGTHAGAIRGADVRENWRKFLEEHERAKANGNDWVRSQLELYLTGQK